MVGFFVNVLVESLHYDVKIFVKLVHRQASTLTCYNFLNHKFNCFLAQTICCQISLCMAFLI